jgi:DMSO reductase family type II enzyme heme b subunit
MLPSNILKILLKFTLIIFGIFLFTACGNFSSHVEKCLENGSCVASYDVVKVSNKLTLDPNDPLWDASDGPKKIMLELGPQMFTNPKWPDPSIKEVTVSVVRNKSELAILLEWEDNAKDNSFGFSERFTDQAAVMFPLEPQEEAPMITMGNEGRTVNIWQWKASWQKDLGPEKESQTRRRQDSSSSSGPVSDRLSPVEDLNAEGFSTLTIQEEQNVQGKGVWRDNRWRVIFRRPLTNSDTADAQFDGSTQMAIAVWNGANKERNGQKGLIGWVLLRFP